MERHTFGLFWISFLRGSVVPAFSATAEFSGTAPPLSNAHHAGFDSMPDRGGNFLRSDFFDSAQEEDFGFDGNAAGHRGNGFGRIKRAD